MYLGTSLSAEAYIGPGAGFAFVSTFLILFSAIAIAIVTLLTWPIRWLFKAFRGGRRLRNRDVARVVIVGLDGQDPELTEQFMQAGDLPNFTRLRESGCFMRLQTVLPAESPVAWSSFQTGTNPGKHRIYDFLVPNRKSMLPELSSTSVGRPARSLKLGPYRIPLGRPRMSVGRKSRPFWELLGEHDVFSTIVRVPLTFPPEKFNGVLLSAMCLPDLKGSQGTYFLYSSDPAEPAALTSGLRLPLERNGNRVCGRISGPQNSLHRDANELTVPFEVVLESGNGAAGTLIVGGQRHRLAPRTYTPWIRIGFHAGLGIRVYGICRFFLLDTNPHVRLYMTPLQIDPERPALPISHPSTYSVYLAKAQGSFATLGVAEDTSALNEGVIDEDAFLEQCRDIHSERETMFFDALEKTPHGLVTCVFDITDRIQHMFWRFLESDHPANQGGSIEQHSGIVRDLYRQMDGLLGRILSRLDDKTILMVLSDHGFKPFRRGVNLNRWLEENGFLSLKPDASDQDMLQGIDWSATRAYAVGFGGIYLNLAGREAYGVVSPGDEESALKREIIARLEELRDDEANGVSPVRKVYDRNEAYSGPYVAEAPDLIVGFRVGYRASWSTVTGGIGVAVIEDNTRPWSGDHNMNPPDVPGIFFCNRPVDCKQASILDIAPTVLELFGVPAPGYMDGQSLKVRSSEAGVEAGA